MSKVMISTDWSFRGFQTLVLENRHLCVVIIPELGGKIWSIRHKARDREMLWHNPRMPPRSAHFGASYDDWFSGGWDELFPNDAAVVINGEAYPDHGEVWSIPSDWDVIDQSADGVTVRLVNFGVVTASRFEKRVTLRADERVVRLTYRIENLGRQPLEFLWKLHPALNLGARPRLDLPARRTVIDGAFGAAFETNEFIWPQVNLASGETRDMRHVPPETAETVDFLYAVELDEGWAALTQPDERIGFGMVFDPDVLSTVWVFGAYSGWRDLYTAILEPCTGYPFRLDQAIAQGTYSRLEPRSELKTEVLAVIYEGLEEVMSITADGVVA